MKYRKRHGLSSFKLTKNSKYKNPHAMPLAKRQQLQKLGYRGQLMIRETERLSQRPFGKFTNSGRFRLDIDKVPFYNIPDLTGFALMPYVSAVTPKIEEKIYEVRKVHLT